MKIDKWHYQVMEYELDNVMKETLGHIAQVDVMICQWVVTTAVIVRQVLWLASKLIVLKVWTLPTATH